MSPDRAVSSLRVGMVPCSPSHSQYHDERRDSDAGWLAGRINGWMTGYMSRWVGGWMDEQRVRASLGRRMTVLRQQQEERNVDLTGQSPQNKALPRTRSAPGLWSLVSQSHPISGCTLGVVSSIGPLSHSLCVSPGHLYANSAPTWNPGPASRLV